MKLIFDKEQITGAGAYRAMYQDEVILTAGAGFGKQGVQEGKHWLRPSSKLTIAELLDLIGDGVEVDEMVVIVKAPVAILQEEVYQGLPSRIREDETVKKFGEWGNNPWRTSNDGTECLILCRVGGHNLVGSEWAVFDLPGNKILDREALDDLLENDVNWAD